MFLPFAQYYKQQWSLNVICKGLPILFLIALLTYHGFQLPWYRFPVKPLILCIKFQIWEIEYFINTYSLEYWKFYLDDCGGFLVCQTKDRWRHHWDWMYETDTIVHVHGMDKYWPGTCYFHDNWMPRQRWVWVSGQYMYRELCFFCEIEGSE